MQNGRPSTLPDAKLGISLEHDSDRLGNGFVSGHEDDSLDVDQDESGSELPWARTELTGTSFICSHSTPFIFISLVLVQSRHSQHRSISENISVRFSLLLLIDIMFTFNSHSVYLFMSILLMRNPPF
jgi:hypothetical protein